MLWTMISRSRFPAFKDRTEETAETQGESGAHGGPALRAPG